MCFSMSCLRRQEDSKHQSVLLSLSSQGGIDAPVLDGHQIELQPVPELRGGPAAPHQLIQLLDAQLIDQRLKLSGLQLDHQYPT